MPENQQSLFASDDEQAIEFTASVKFGSLEAAEGETPKPPTFEMVANTGASMRLEGFSHPVVVDLQGVFFDGESIPILRGHDQDKIVGHGEVAVTEESILVKGTISADNDHSRDVVSLSKNGFPWQASIGASVLKGEFVKKGDTAVVNGETHHGPLIVSRKTPLNEISFVPRGADRRTSAKVAAKSAGTPKRVTMAELHSRRIK